MERPNQPAGVLERWKESACVPDRQNMPDGVLERQQEPAGVPEPQKTMGKCQGVNKTGGEPSRRRILTRTINELGGTWRN